MKRKIFAILLAVTMLAALTACGNNDAGANNSPSPAPSAPEQSPEPSAPAEPSEPPAQGGGDVDLQAFYESFTTNEEFNANMEVVDDFLAMYYAGLPDIATRQQVIYMPMRSGAVCEIALVEVENAADVDAVKDIFQKRIDDQVGTDDEPGLAWYPASVEAWKNESRIVSNGNFVMLIAWAEHSDEVVEAFNALF